MKNQVVALFIILMIVTACKNQSQIDYALFSGKIENPVGETITIESNDIINFSKTIKLNKDGSFADTLYMAAGYYTLKYNKVRVRFYLEPEFNLNTTINTEAASDVEEIKIEGVGAENSNYLIAKDLVYSQILPDFAAFYSQEEGPFLEGIKNLESSWDSLLINTPNLSKDFISFEQKDINYFYLLSLERYAFYHGFFTGKQNVEVSEKFKTPLDGFDFGNEANYKFFTRYHDLVRQHYANKIKDKNKNDVIAAFDEINAYNAPMLKESLADKFSTYISPSEDNNEALYNGVLKLSSNDEFKKELVKKYEKIKPLTKGNPSPLFNNYENHKGGNTSLEDLKGKYVYMDIWATWCAPCIREIPSLKKLESAYRDKNIEFVSISIDYPKDYDKWVNMVNEKELSGVQLLADNAYESKFIKDYLINSIPRFILLNPEGKIVSGSAPRPSDPKLIEIFEELDIR